MNIEQLIAGVRELATKYPGAVYKSVNGICYYTKGVVENGPETCGCIFGQVLVPVLGKEVFEITECGGTFIPPITYILTAYFGLHPINKDGKRENSYRWCKNVQVQQDRGLTWSQAVAVADSRTPL